MLTTLTGIFVCMHTRAHTRMRLDGLDILQKNKQKCKHQ